MRGSAHGPEHEHTADSCREPALQADDRSGGVTVVLRDTDDEALKGVVVRNVGAVDSDAPAVIAFDGVVRGDGSRSFWRRRPGGAMPSRHTQRIRLL